MIIIRNFTDLNLTFTQTYRDTIAGNHCLPLKLTAAPG